MGVEKAELKMAVAHELGASFDDALEAAQQDIYRWDGAKTSLKKAATAVEGLLAHLKRDFEEEKITEEEAALVRKWLRRSVEVVRNLRTQAEVHEQRAYGRAEALKTSVKITKALYESEEQKLKALRDHKEPVDERSLEPPARREGARPVGTRPPNRIAALKRVTEIADGAKPPEQSTDSTSGS